MVFKVGDHVLVNSPDYKLTHKSGVYIVLSVQKEVGAPGGLAPFPYRCKELVHVNNPEIGMYLCAPYELTLVNRKNTYGEV